MTYVYLLIVLNVLGMTRRVNWQHVFLNIFLGCNLSGVNIAPSRHGPALFGLATATGCRRDEFICDKSTEAARRNCQGPPHQRGLTRLTLILQLDLVISRVRVRVRTP